MTDTDDTNAPGGIGAIVAMRLEVSKLYHPEHVVDALRDDIEARAGALGLEAVEVSLTQDGDNVTACVTFDQHEADGTPWQQSFTREVQHG